MLGGVYRSFVELEEIARRSHPNLDAHARLTGFLFMRAGLDLADKMIVPSLNYFDLLSAQYMNFIVAGWSKLQAGRGTQFAAQWIYSDEDFIRACTLIEERTNWRYSGGTDLLLCTTLPDRGQSTAIDFNAVISISLDKLRDGKIDSPEIILKRVIDFAKSYRGSDPLPALSFQEARVSLFEAVVDTVVGLISKDAKEKATYAKQFLVKDVRKEGQWNKIRFKLEERAASQKELSAPVRVANSVVLQRTTADKTSAQLPQRLQPHS